MNKYQEAFDKLLTLDSPDVEQIEQLELRGADYYHELLDTLYDLVEKETATQPDIEGDGYEYCPECGQHIDRAIFTDQNDSSEE